MARRYKALGGKKLPVMVAAILLVVLVATAAVLAVLRLVNNSPNKEDPVQESNDKIYISDYNGGTYVKSYDVDVNEYDSESFVQANGRISYTAAETKTGIDVSAHQGEIDWASVKADGIDFAIIRAGFRGYTEGAIVQDKRFIENIEGALANDMKVGVYFFSQAITEEEAKQEAQFVLDLIKDYDISYPVSYDWEHIVNYNEDSVPRTNNISDEAVTSFAKIFCETIKSSGYTSSFYINKNLGYSYFDLDELSDHDIWYAEYASYPSFYYDFYIWQYSESGTVNGISTTVDLNLSFRSY